MKKIYALILTVVMLLTVSVPVFANNVISPSGDAVEEGEGDKSPETGSLSLLYIGLAGTACVATAVGAGIKAKKEA